MEDLLEFISELRNIYRRIHWKGEGGLVALRFDFFSQLRARADDRKAIFIKESFDSNHGFDVAFAIHSLPGAAFDRFQLRKLRLPKAQNISWQTT